MGALETPVQLSYNITTLGPGRAYAYISLFREGTQADFQLSMTWTLRQVLQVDDRRTSPRIGAMSAMMWQMVLARIYRSMNSFIGTASRSAGQLSATVARSNADMQAWNSRIFDVLRTSTHAQFEDDIHACWDWWREYNELAPGGEKPLVTQAGRVGREEKYRTVFISQSCFTPGTMVWAETGPRKIEQVQIGDRVLSQDLETGELAYKLVVNTTVRPPSDILRVQAGDSEVFTTLGHPFWVVGEGWRMAKQLKPGDRIHTVDGALVVDDIVQGVPSLAHNLIVEDFRTYFVGANRLLVHDNGVRMPTKALVPGLSGERLH